jgi:hypothetical protein
MPYAGQPVFGDLPGSALQCVGPRRTHKTAKMVAVSETWHFMRSEKGTHPFGNIEEEIRFERSSIQELVPSSGLFLPLVGARSKVF